MGGSRYGEAGCERACLAALMKRNGNGTGGGKRFKVDGLLYNTSFNGAALRRHLSDGSNIRTGDEPPQRTGQHLENFLHPWNKPNVHTKKKNNTKMKVVATNQG